MTVIATHMLYRAASGKTVEGGSPRCALCGCPHAKPVPIEDVIKDTFTDHGMLRMPSSRDVCPACAHFFNHRWDSGQKYPSEYRKHSLYIEPTTWRSWQRADMRRDIETRLRDGGPQCVALMSLAKKKQLLPLADVTPAGKTLCVQFEQERVLLSGSRFFEVAVAFDALLSLGFTKGAILEGTLHSSQLRKLSPSDAARALRANASLASLRPSGLLSLVSYVTITQEQHDDERPASDDD